MLFRILENEVERRGVFCFFPDLRICQRRLPELSAEGGAAVYETERGDMVKKKYFQIFVDDEAKNNEHFHQDIELMYILDGSLDVTIENKTSHLRAEDIFIVNANRKHSFVTGANILMLRLMINYQMAAEASKNGDVIFWCDSSVSESERYNELRRILRNMLRHYVENREYMDTFGYLSDCYAVLEHLTANFLMSATDLRMRDDGDRYEERLRQINNYINNNFDQPISMKELSEKLYLSNGYLSRFFKKNYGMSFASYLTNVRVYHASDDLLYTDEPITRIAYNNGFASAALFNKVFKKINGLTPTEFRRKNQNGTHVEEKSRREGVEKRLEKMVGPEPASEDQNVSDIVAAEGEYSAEFYNELKNNWGNLINFGDASNLLHSSIREHLLILRQALNFEYVRFWSIFTEEFFIRPEQQQYNFSQIDSVIDFVLEQGLIPHIELGLKPQIIHDSIGNSRVKPQYIMDSFELRDWDRLMRAFMRHLSNRYGQNILDNWRMELWFDENWRHNNENGRRYLDYFDVTYRAIKACNENIQVGGYGIRMDVGFERRKKFLSIWNKQKSRPDFLSVMFYAYERGEDELDRYAKRTTDNDAFVHTITKEKKLIADAGMGDLPVIVSEWNLTPSVRNYINDTSFKGAYIVKNVIDLYGITEVMGYGAGSDRQYTSFDTPDILFGGTGLLTRDAIMKPAAFAFDFLNRLYPYYIGKDRNYLITTDGHDNYGIICHNQQILNYNYYLTPEDEMEKEAIWKYFENTRRLDVKIRLTGVTEGAYRVKVYRISDYSGSVLKIWSDLDYEQEPSRDDIKYFRRMCEPAMTIHSAEAHDGELMIEQMLLPNEIAFLRVKYNA